jgi:hypothetical protein
MAQMQAQTQLDQLNTKIQSQDWTKDINYRDQATGLCPSCGRESGAGKFCQEGYAKPCITPERELAIGTPAQS